MKNIDIKASGAPDISLSGLKIWISGRQFEDSTDFWDANWLVITAHCSSYFSEVIIQGPIIHLSELELWMSEWVHSHSVRHFFFINKNKWL